MFGRPSTGLTGWVAGPPYGTDMIIAVASSIPLFTHALPSSEPVEAYRAALAAAMQRATAAGALLSPAVMLVQTRIK